MTFIFSWELTLLTYSQLLYYSLTKLLSVLIYFVRELGEFGIFSLPSG